MSSGNDMYRLSYDKRRLLVYWVKLNHSQAHENFKHDSEDISQIFKFFLNAEHWVSFALEFLGVFK